MGVIDIITDIPVNLLLPTHLAYAAAGSPEWEKATEGPGQCALCGMKSDNLGKKEFSNSFTDWFMLKAPEQYPYICPACNFVLDNLDTFYFRSYLITPDNITFFYSPDKKPANTPPFGESKAVTREELQNILCHPPSVPWILHLQPGGNRKHILPKMNVNMGNENGFWTYHGETGFWIDNKRIKELFHAFNVVRANDLHWNMATGIEPKEEAKKAIWNDIKDILNEYRQKPYFLFLYNRFSAKPNSRKDDI